jgi:serine/threonine protein kinase
VSDARCPRCHAATTAELLGRFGGICPDCLSSFATGDDLPEFPGFTLLAKIGEGGMGVVYKAIQAGLDRTVALKVLSPRLTGDPDFVKRFGREARALAQLQHPHVVAVHDHGIHGGLPYFVMDFVEGKSLRSLMSGGRLPPARALELARQVGSALEYAHGQGVIHRDLKPENILVDAEGRVHVADFGLAKIVASETTGLTRTNAVMGTPRYMAPEQIESPGDIDARTDLYALGVLLYEMLTGGLPLGLFKPPSKVVPLDRRMDAIVHRALQKERGARFADAREMNEALSKAASPPARRPALLGTGLAAGVAAILAAFWFTRAPSPAPTPPDPATWQGLGGSASGGGVSASPGNSIIPAIALDGAGRPVVAWFEKTGETSEIRVRRWDGAAWKDVGSAGLPCNPDKIEGVLTLALDPSDRPLVAWAESPGVGSSAIHLRRWTGSEWGKLGASAPISRARVHSVHPELAMDASGRPLVAWQEGTPGKRRVVASAWDGSAWTGLAESVSRGPGDAASPAMTTDAAGMPVIAWRDSTSGNDEIYVCRWNGTAWVEYGGSATGGGVSGTAGYSGGPTIALDAAGNPVVAWHDDPMKAREILVRRWDGRAWVELGGSGSGGGISRSAAVSMYAVLRVDPAGNPVVTWQDGTAEIGECWLRRWDGATWRELAGSGTGAGLGATPVTSSHPALALDASGNPWVAWSEQASSNAEIFLKRWSAEARTPR